MQRLFSTFADGWPGGGLLLLRLLTGGLLIAHGMDSTGAGATTLLLVLRTVGAVAGLFILGGLWTPVAGVLTGMVEVWISFAGPGIQSSTMVLATLGVSLAMIGPGAWSIDARIYGRKQILPPEP